MGHLHRFADRAAGAQTVRAADIQGVCRWLLHPSSHSGLSNHSTKAGQCQSDAGTLSPPTGRRARGPGSGRDQTAVAATSCPWKVTLATGQEAGARPLTSCQVRLWAGWAPDLPAGESPSSAANPGRGSVRQPWGQGVCELVLASENKARRRVIAKQPRAAFIKSGFKTGWCFCESGLTGAIGGWAGTMWAAGGGDSALCPCLTLGMGLGEGPDGRAVPPALLGHLTGCQICEAAVSSFLLARDGIRRVGGCFCYSLSRESTGSVNPGLSIFLTFTGHCVLGFQGKKPDGLGIAFTLA